MLCCCPTRKSWKVRAFIEYEYFDVLRSGRFICSLFAAALLLHISLTLPASPQEILLQHQIEPPVNEYIAKLKDEGASVLSEIRRQHGRHEIHQMNPLDANNSATHQRKHELQVIVEEREEQANSLSSKMPANGENAQE
jgi:hypothetical protein